MEGAPSVCPPEYVQRFALERVVLTNNSDLWRIPIEVVVGSVSCGPSIAFRTPS